MKKMNGQHQRRTTTGVRRLISEISVEPVLFLYMLSTFSQYALFQDLVWTKVCVTQYNGTVCENLHHPEYEEQLDKVQTNSSHWILMSTVTLVVPSLLITIYLGSWSDRFGRKLPICFPPLGAALSCLVYIVISFKADAPVAWILFASLISGLSGGFVSCIMSCMSYVASVSTEDNRTVRISRLEAMTFLGGTIGPFISGSMLQVTGHGYAFCFMMASYLLAFLYALFVVRDVYDGEPRPASATTAAAAAIPRRRRRRQGPTSPSSHLPLPPPSSSDCPIDSPLSHGLDDHVTETCSDMDMEAGAADDNHITTTTSLLYGDKIMATATPTNSTTIVTHNECNSSMEDDRLTKERRENRPSVWSGESSGSSSGGSSSSNDSSRAPSTQDDLPSDDDRRNIILTNNPSFSSDKTCCSRYFGSQHFTDALSTAFKRREGNRRLFLILVVISAFIAMMATAGELDVAYLFAKDQPLKWSYQTYSYYFGFKYGLGAFMLLVGMPLFQRLQLQDTTICLLGLVSRMAGLIFYGLSTTTTMAFFVPVVAIFSFFTIPATRALLSKLVEPSEHGKMFSFVAIMEDLCTLSASVLFNSIYPITRQIYNAGVFLLMAGILFIPLIIIWIVRRKLVLKSLDISCPSPIVINTGQTSSSSPSSSSSTITTEPPLRDP